MTRPEDISQEAWDKAKKPANMASAAWNTPQLAHCIIARAIQSALLEQLERDAKMVDPYIWDDHALAQATEVGMAMHMQAVEISDNIRSQAKENTK